MIKKLNRLELVFMCWANYNKIKRLLPDTISEEIIRTQAKCSDSMNYRDDSVLAID